MVHALLRDVTNGDGGEPVERTCHILDLYRTERSLPRLQTGNKMPRNAPSDETLLQVDLGGQ